jgi:hypothetical protein
VLRDADKFNSDGLIIGKLGLLRFSYGEIDRFVKYGIDGVKALGKEEYEAAKCDDPNCDLVHS